MKSTRITTPVSILRPVRNADILKPGEAIKMELTADQKETLKEIPGYVRIEMLERYIRFYMKLKKNGKTDRDHGYRMAMMNLGFDLQNGWLNDNERFKV
jgi:hypothetical protein